MWPHLSVRLEPTRLRPGLCPYSRFNVAAPLDAVGTNLTTGLLCDGHTMAATISNTVPDMVLESERLSSVYEVNGSIVDKIQIHITGTSGAFIENLILDNVDAWAGEMYLSRMKIGTATFNNSNKVGDGSGVDSASCSYESSVNARNITNTIQDRPIKVQ